MAGVCGANDVNTSLTTHLLAVLADLLDAGANFHDHTQLRLIAEMTPRDAASVEHLSLNRCWGQEFFKSGIVSCLVENSQVTRRAISAGFRGPRNSDRFAIINGWPKTYQKTHTRTLIPPCSGSCGMIHSVSTISANCEFHLISRTPAWWA